MNVKFTFNRNNISQSTQPGLKAHVQYVSKVVDSPAPSGIGAKSITANGTYYSASEGLEGYNVVDVNVSGGGGTLIEKSVSANGVYNASSDSADGYSKVTVSVPASAVDTGTKSISTNGTHDVVGYASANVSVPASAVDSGTKSITSNGTHDVVGYASASVNVPNSYAAADEGKVVSSGALVAQTSDTVTQNGTVDTTLINSLTVNVSGGTLPRLLNHVEYTLVSDATQSNKQSIQLTAVSTNNYVLFLTPKTYPSAPSTGYTALNWIRFVIGGTASDNKGTILRADGTVGTDGNMASYSPNTGVMQIGGQYGTFRTGQVFDIYLFEMA